MIAVYGATGYTGRLVVAELARHGLHAVLVGRSLERVRHVRDTHGLPSFETREAALDSPDGLTAAFADAGVVINCAGPFTETGMPVIDAAIAAGAHYLDPTGEQPYLKRVFDEADGRARSRGVTVIPACANDGLLGDLAASLAAPLVAPVADVLVVYRLIGFGLTRGSLISTLEALQGNDFVYADGEWRPAGLRTRHPAFTFPGERRSAPMQRFPASEVVTVPHHVKADSVRAAINASALAPGPFARLVPSLSPATALLLRTPLRRALRRVVNRLPEGPTEERRRKARFMFVAEATGRDGRLARGVVEGTDVYGGTARILVEAAQRLIAQPPDAGVLAPAQAFPAADFLDAVGVTWSAEVVDA